MSRSRRWVVLLNAKYAIIAIGSPSARRRVDNRVAQRGNEEITRKSGSCYDWSNLRSSNEIIRNSTLRSANRKSPKLSNDSLDCVQVSRLDRWRRCREIRRKWNIRPNHRSSLAGDTLIRYAIRIVGNRKWKSWI